MAVSTNTLSGARSRFSVGGQIVGFASGVSGGESINYDPINVLDLLEVREHVPVAYTANLSAQIFRVIGKSLKALGIFPKEDNILTTGVMTATLEDKITGESYAEFQGVKCASVNWDVTSTGVVSMNTDFVCIRLLDEAELAISGSV